MTLWETPLKDHVTQNTLKFILGQRDLGEWDAYVNELKAKNSRSTSPGQQGVRAVQEGTRLIDAGPAGPPGSGRAAGTGSTQRRRCGPRAGEPVGAADRRLAPVRRHRALRPRPAARLPGLAGAGPAGDRLPPHPRARPAQRRRGRAPPTSTRASACPARLHLRGPGRSTPTSGSASSPSWSWASCRRAGLRRQTVFWWRGNVTPPRSWQEWADLVRATLAHLVDRYGLDGYAAGRSRCGTSPTSRSSGRAPTRTPTTGSTR